MSLVTWLHLSDWHQAANDYDRKIVAQKLINDLDNRHKIDERLREIDFIVFSGDLAFGGEKEQFELATKLLIRPIRKAIGSKVPFYCVPGNHDIQRTTIPNVPESIAKVLEGGSSREIEHLLQDEDTIKSLNGPLRNFYDFARKQGCKYDERKLFCTQLFRKGDSLIGIACINTAWLCARYDIQPRSSIVGAGVWDRGVLRTTEAQIRDALDKLEKADVKIVVMHHPFDWLEEADQARAEQLIGSKCHIVMHGHGHRPNMNRLSNAFGDIVLISAGASYDRRLPSDPRYTNAYNFCSIETNNKEGTLFHRVWSDESDRWRADDRFWLEARSSFSMHKEPLLEPEKVVRGAINQLTTNSLRQLNRRVVISHTVEIKHKIERIDGEQFVRATARNTISFYAGAPERFPIRTIPNSRLAAHENSKISENAFRLLKVSQNSEIRPISGAGQYEGFLELGPEEQEIEYAYELLETLSGVHYFGLMRFAAHAKITLLPDPSLGYEFLPVGGFPVKRLDERPSRYVWETHEPAVPNQGLMIEWYPKT